MSKCLSMALNQSAVSWVSLRSTCKAVLWCIRLAGDSTPEAQGVQCSPTAHTVQK